MGLFDRIKGPVFLKESNSLQRQLEALENIKTENEEICQLIQQDIRRLKYGIAGEEKIAFELKNSHISMFVLHDLHIEYEGLSAQIDYLLVTRSRIFILECKNLYGNIEINSNGDFIRTVQYGRGYKKEGIYSPVTQNRRHLELIKEIIVNRQTNILKKAAVSKFFYDNYKSVVVLANPNTVLNARYAKKEIKNQVIRADRLTEYIKSVNGSDILINEDAMERYANFFLSLHKENETDYTARYADMIKNTEPAQETWPADTDSVPLCPKCGAVMVKRKAAKGAFAGNEFWGCSNYPRCRYIINISSGNKP